MNLKKSILILALASIIFVGCKEKSNETDVKETAETTEATAPKVKKEIAAANLQTASFAIDGMTCAMGCAKTIENKLAAQEGVGQAVVDFDTKIATVKFDAEKQSLESLTKTIEGVAGGDSYKVTESKKM